ncbi:hypothetical protein GALL_401670 [mine drainage metagenome]|uniref:Uncharacterized protein n=1 Tax=mine drainage metagenome TaxID=410659 RepID=A0A1J5QKV4_9ZZZZ
MRFISDSLEQIERLAVARKEDGILIIGRPEFLHTFGQTNRRNLLPRLFDRLRCGVDLWCTAVDHDQLRRVGKPAGVSTRFNLVGYVLGSQAISFQSAKASGDYLHHGSGIVGAAQLILFQCDGEPSVFALTWEPIFEDHHGGNHLSPLKIGDVETLDSKWHLIQRE